MHPIEPGSITLTATDPNDIATITAATPVNRDALQSYIANLRQTVFQGVQVPFRVIHVDAVTGSRVEELVPGCATCSW